MTDSVYPVQGPLFKWPFMGHKKWLRQNLLHGEEVKELVISADGLTFRCKSGKEFTPQLSSITVEVFSRRLGQVKRIELKGQIQGRVWSNNIVIAGTSLLGGTLVVKGKLLKRSKNFSLLAEDLQRCCKGIVTMKRV